MVGRWVEGVVRCIRNFRIGAASSPEKYRRDERVRLGLRARIEEGAFLSPGRSGLIEAGEDLRLHRGAILACYGGTIRFGDRCGVGPYSVLYGHGGLVIGNDVRIAAHVVIIPANHIFDDPLEPISSQGLTKQGVRIGDDVWIGAGARILDGVQIADGCVIAAGAVVTRSTEPLGVYAGVPARRVAVRGQNLERPTDLQGC